MNDKENPKTVEIIENDNLFEEIETVDVVFTTTEPRH